MIDWINMIELEWGNHKLSKKMSKKWETQEGIFSFHDESVDKYVKKISLH
jgi:hypothetical protein